AWHISGVPVGNHTVTATLAGYAEQSSSPFEVVAGETTVVPPLILSEATGSLSGTALLAGETDHAGISVVVEGTSYSAVTDATGAWSITDVPTGNYSVRASRAGYDDEVATDQQVSAGQNTGVGTLTLQLSSYMIVYVSGGSQEDDPAQTGTAGQPLAEPFVVRVLDPFSVGASDLTVTFTVEDGAGSVEDEELFSDGGGFASTTLTLGTNTALENRVVARSDATPGQSVTFLAYAEADAPDHISVSGDGQTGSVGQPLAEDLAVTVLDQYENPVPGRNVTFTPAAEHGFAEPASAATDDGGTASTTWTLGTTLETSAGEQTLVAAVEGGELEHAFYAVNHSDAPFSMTKVSGDGQFWHVSSELPAPLVVAVEDSHGNPCYGWEVTWSTADGGSLAPAASPVGLDGLSSTVASSGATAGSQSFTASCGAEEVTFTAEATSHHIERMRPDRVWPGYPHDLEVEISGAGFDAGAVVVWNAGGDEQSLIPSSVEAERIFVTLPASLLVDGGVFPLSVDQAGDGRCAAVDFEIRALLPDTGQTSCYDDDWETSCPAEGEEYFGQDAQFGWDLYVAPAERFERSEPIVGEPVVFDRITQLEWQGCAAGESGSDCAVGEASELAWEDALDYCEALDWGGHDDWELPAVTDLLSIVNSGLHYPAIDTDVFPGSGTGDSWSSTTEAWRNTMVWVVRLYSGHLVSHMEMVYEHKARCVRGAAPDADPFEALVVLGERLVEDVDTGLVWQGCAAGKSGESCENGEATSMEWPEALAYCADLSWGGFDDWRLPSRAELMSTVSFDDYDPAVDEALFPETPPANFWMSTTYEPSTSKAWHVYLDKGSLSAHDKTYYSFRCRCVRGGP
ncbi:MAG: DUF1566 domain-containing protein, partial [Polyangia bacterium]